MTDTAKFYVYEHWRPDQDVCFWVGKGTGDRAYRFKRNAGYDAIVAILAHIGMCVEVRMVDSGMTSVSALALEEARIKFWRSTGVVLTNRNNGGRGAGKIISDATREKLRVANLGKRASPETRAKMSEAQRGRPSRPASRPKGYKHRPETIAKIVAANKGKKRSEAQKQRIREINVGKRHTQATKKKMSLSRIGNTNGRGGKGLKRSQETIARMSQAQKKAWQERRENGRLRSPISAS